MKSIKVYLLTVALALLAVCSNNVRAAEKLGADYKLGVEDVVEIMVAPHEGLNRIVTIRPDGYITVPRVDKEVRAAGKTARALAAEIQAILAEDPNNVKVTVNVKEVRPRRVRVLGAVKTAGTYELKPKWRLMDVVALAGGLSTKPVRISGRVVRAGKVIPLNIEQAVAKPASDANVLLAPDDLIMLDEQIITKQVHVSGQVNKPGAYDLEEGLTPVSLIAETGGPTVNATLSKAYVLRGAGQIPLDLHAVLIDGKDDPRVTRFRFQPGDVLVVPENQARYSIMGQVTKPGYYSLPEKQNEATVLKVLATAGGQLMDSDLKKASITRVIDGQSKVIPVNIDAMLKGEVPDDVVLQADDVLYIPESNEQVHVIGKVNKPGAYDIKEGLTLMSLVAEAGSSAAGAGLSKAYVLRNGTQIPVNLRAALIDGKADETITNFKLQNGDVLVVPDVTNQVSVSGQVNKPGVYDLDDRLTVASLIGQAGGVVEEKAALTKAHVLRQGTQIRMNLQAVLSGDGTADPSVANFKFQPGDVLVVPETEVRYAVLGQVNKPGYYAYPEKKGQATILNALSEAGGQAANSDLTKAGIVRVVNGQAISIPVNINDMLRKAGPGSQIELQPGDVLYVPTRKEKTNWLPLLGPIALLLQ